jgi:hypothetical protein
MAVVPNGNSEPLAGAQLMTTPVPVAIAVPYATATGGPFGDVTGGGGAGQVIVGGPGGPPPVPPLGCVGLLHESVAPSTTAAMK